MLRVIAPSLQLGYQGYSMQAILNFRPLGIDFFCLGKKFLVFNLVSRNLKIKYRRSVLGVFWTLLSPLAMAVIYYFVFKVVLRVQIPHYLIFILSGVLPWSFFGVTLNEGLDSILFNGSLISKVPVPTQVFPFVVSVTNLITLVLSIPVFIGAALFSHLGIGWAIFMVPVYISCLFLFAYSTALTLAVIYVFFRDLKYIVGILMQFWFYATPVVYDSNMIPEKFRWVLYVNPLGLSFAELRNALLRAQWPTAGNLATIVAWTAGAALLALMMHRQLGRGIAENI
jgi:ABC-2 type transport system permease protein